ncbi:glycosyltransferase family 2 protein [Candidatus Pacearchaeota archaeon]|nr:glycosyltransferase family 2 protein [Candidatus Pacearchaeota archaeon]
MEETKVATGEISVDRLSSVIQKALNSLIDRAMLLFVLGITCAFTVTLAFYLSNRLTGVDASPTIMVFILFKAVIEIWCSLYAGYFVFISLYYLGIIGKKTREDIVNNSDCPSLVAVYLCCEDVVPDCLESLCNTKTNNSFKIIVHDDSQSLKEKHKVDQTVQMLSEKYDVDIEVMRRGNREGGKPGAMNYVLQRIPESFEWMLLCDNDSLSMDTNWYLKVSPKLRDPKLACVQFRNVGTTHESASGLMKNLTSSIDVFEVFVSPAERYGWLPFFGHNGILRLSAVREVGGFQPGEFADDIDMSIRLNLKGYRIHYRKDIAFSESHPENYRAFRARSYKWAYGCSSVLRRWTMPILKSKEMKLQQKFFFFIFIGFYFTQILLLSYLTITYFIMPLMIPRYDFSPIFSVFGGSLVIFLMYLPTIAYYLGNDILHKWPAFGLSVGMIYGSIDFVSARAVIDCLLKRERTWIPTNTVKSGFSNPVSSWFESAMGFGMLAIPFVMLPHLLYLPCSYLFALKFLSIPLLYMVYKKVDIPQLLDDPLVQMPKFGISDGK